VKKLLVVLIALGVAGAIAYFVFSRERETSERDAEPEIDLRETAPHEAAEPGTQFADIVGSTFGAAN
jgi:hypothetical protein